MKKWMAVLLALALLNTGFSQNGNNAPVSLKKKGTASQLYVNNEPFLVLGGETGNSSASSLAYMKSIWPVVRQMHLNTLLEPVYWELMEPSEGRFDFTLVDSILADARKHAMKLVFLWFGSWKNSMSTYVPAWVKQDQQRFPRAQVSNGSGVEILSAFHPDNVNADAAAFAALMRHLREVDRPFGTVIMMQVENEIGMLPEAREHTAEANKAFKSELPDKLKKYLKANREKLTPELRERWQAHGEKINGSWEQVFGEGLETEELFQAWYYAGYANTVAARGKKEYNIPMFVNAALNYKKVKPGQYPSAGPLPHLMDIWAAAAPDIDILSPDFYNPYFKEYCDLYTRNSNPLFIPEIRFEPSDEAKVYYAVGHYHAIGFSPFSIESTTHPQNEPIGKSYAQIQSLMPVILKYQGTKQLDGVLLDEKGKTQELTFGDYTLTVSHDYTLGWSPEAKKGNWPVTGGLIIQTGKDEFIVAGTGIVITAATKDRKAQVGILKAEEVTCDEQGVLQSGRYMNGDQTHQGRHIRIAAGDWGIQKITFYQYN